MADYLVQEDGTSRFLLEDGSGNSILLESTPSGGSASGDARFGAAIFGWPYYGEGAGASTDTPTASPGTFAITGAAATLKTARLLTLSPGSVAVTGTAATFALLVAGQHSLDVFPGTMSITGVSAGLVFEVSRAQAVGRVNIAWDDGPLVATPVWTRIDDNNVFPVGFVAGYDITTGRQSLVSQTDTGTATVYINDRAGLFDDRNSSSPYQGKLSGRQILLQLYDPVRGVWEEQFRGLIEDYNYDIDGSAVDANGDPVNASIQIECVDVFDYLAGYGLTPGLDGVYPAGVSGGAPAGGEDGIWYAETAGSVQDRIIEVMADVGIDPSMYTVFSGNVRVQAAKYDPDEAALMVLRDCADAELPFIGNIYVDRHGRFAFRGRYSRFYPDDVAAEPNSDWDFHRWKVGDGAAIQSDPTRAQIRELSYSRSRANIINAAIAYPKGLNAVDMPGQVYANAPSILAYGKHTPPGPMSDLLTLNGTTSGNDGKTETALFAKLLVENQKDPILTLTACQLKSINPTDARASATWKMLTQCDISDIVNVAAGYPGGTGFTGSSPQDDYYVEGRHMTVRPANSGYDYVELNLEVSAARWSMDTHSVFPNPFA